MLKSGRSKLADTKVEQKLISVMLLALEVVYFSGNQVVAFQFFPV